MNERLLLDSIARAHAHFFAEQDAKLAFDGLLADLLALTGSEYGFVGDVLRDVDGAPYVRTCAITNIAWDAETRRMVAEVGTGGLEFRNLRTLFGAALTTGQVVISNDPASDPRRGGLPTGHPPLRAFLAIPLLSRGELIGLAGIANRPGGYDEALVTALEPFLATCSILLAARRDALDRCAASERLRRRIAIDDLLGQLARDFAIADPRDADRVVETALAAVMRELGAQRAFCVSRDGSRDEARVSHCVGLPLLGEVDAFDLSRFGEPLAQIERTGVLSVRDPSALRLADPALDAAMRDVSAFVCLAGGSAPFDHATVFHFTSDGARVDDSDLPAFRRLPQLIKSAFERKQALAELDNRGRQFLSLMEMLPQALVVTDLSRRVLFANRAARALGVGVRGEGAHPSELVHPDDRRALDDAVDAALERGRLNNVETRLRVAGGEYHPFLVTFVPDFPEFAGVPAYLWTAVDVSEQRALEARLRDSEKLEALGRLAGGIAHDFNNVLTAVIGHADLAELVAGSSIQVRRELEGIRDASERASALTRQLLAFARQQPTQPRALDLSALVRRVETMLRRLIGENVRLEVRTSFGALPVLGDASQRIQATRQFARREISRAEAEQEADHRDHRQLRQDLSGEAVDEIPVPSRIDIGPEEADRPAGRFLPDRGDGDHFVLSRSRSQRKARLNTGTGWLKPRCSVSSCASCCAGGCSGSAGRSASATCASRCSAVISSGSSTPCLTRPATSNGSSPSMPRSRILRVR